MREYLLSEIKSNFISSEIKFLYNQALKEVKETLNGQDMIFPIHSRIRFIKSSRVYGVLQINKSLELCVIYLSDLVLSQSKEFVKNTLIHEILHAYQGCQKHTGLWKINAELMNRKYGYNIKRTRPLENKNNIEKKYKYKVVCGKCGATSFYYKKSNVINHPEQYICKRCKTDAFKVFKIA